MQTSAKGERTGLYTVITLRDVSDQADAGPGACVTAAPESSVGGAIPGLVPEGAGHTQHQQGAKTQGHRRPDSVAEGSSHEAFQSHGGLFPAW